MSTNTLLIFPIKDKSSPLSIKLVVPVVPVGFMVPLSPNAGWRPEIPSLIDNLDWKHGLISWKAIQAVGIIDTRDLHLITHSHNYLARRDLSTVCLKAWLS